MKEESGWRELVRFILIALAMAVLIRVFIAEPYVVSGSSMVPTFENKNYLIVDKISYKLNNPERRDVVVFRPPINPKVFYIKRIIGLPNETVDIKNGVVTIINEKHKDGFKLDEPYVKNTLNDNKHVELKSDGYFVMGDNRSGSSDSRSWGAVPEKFFQGRALLRLRLWPINNLVDVLPGSYKQPE